MILLLSLRTAYRYGLGATEKAENPNACLWKIEKMIYKILTYHLQVIQYIVSVSYTHLEPVDRPRFSHAL